MILSMARTGIAPVVLPLLLAVAGMAQTPPATPAQPPAPAQTCLRRKSRAGGYIGQQRLPHLPRRYFPATFTRTRTSRVLPPGKEPPERTGCESCHGPGKAHVEARGGKTTIPHAFSLMTPKAVLEDCLGCHGRDFNRANIRRSEHTLHDVACTSCHSIHHSATPKYLLAKQQRELCYTCHATIRAQFDMPSKHRVNEGFMECSDCHNPHGAFAPTWRMGQRPRMVEQARDQRRGLPQVPRR